MDPLKATDVSKFGDGSHVQLLDNIERNEHEFFS